MASGSLETAESSILLLSAAAQSGSNTIPLADPSTDTIIPISGITEIYINNPVTGNTPQSTIMPGNGYTGSICWTPADAKFAADTSYTATVTLTADSTHQFATDATANVQGAQVDPQSIVVSTETQGNTLTFEAVFPATQQASDASGDTPLSSSNANAGSFSAASSGGTSAGGASGGSSSSSVTSSSDTNTSESPLLTTAFTLSSGKADTLSVSIDELDIMSVQEGQDVTIVLDALPEETFHGTVSKISASGNIQSGVTTYPVTITLTDVGDAAVMAGMNATATISIATSENVLLIPLDALQESGSEKFVLVAGSPDGESGMSERRTVETGLSDGTNVEITSGLSEGEQIIYEQSASTDSSGQSTFPGGGMGGMPGGGVEMPSGGGMPGGTGGGPMGS